MQKISNYGMALALAALVACTPEARNYGTGGGAGGGIGGAGGAGGAGGGEDVAAACDSYAFDVCKRFQDCSPNNILGSFGDVETCHTRYVLFCEGVLGLSDTGWTPAQMKACGEAYASYDCDLYLVQPFRTRDSLTPAPCVPPHGARLDGAACLDHGQCQSGHCHHTGFTLCGVCGAPAAEGASCGANPDCQTGMICINGKCTKAGEAGESCVAGQIPCNVPWTCLNGTCVKSVDLKQPCGTGQPPCDFFQGLYCDESLGTCENATFVEPGKTCELPSTAPVYCEAASVCGKAGTCVPHAAEGEACDATNGPLCMAPALCLAGQCKIADSANCP